MKKTLLKTSLILALFQLTACNGERDYEIENEPYFKYAWHFDSKSNFAQNNYINEEADINIKEAWKITKGEGVIVAVIDDAFEAGHEDLKENVIHTYSIDNKTSDVSKSIYEGALHGSTVAGFIASPANGKGLVGAAPEAKLVLIQQSYTYDKDTIKAFEYAKNKGAKVINCSWGTKNVSESVAYAIAETKKAGITIIFASGNEQENLDGLNQYGLPIYDESELDSVIGVGASNEYNDIASYSNYGKHIDLMATGGDIIGILGVDDSGENGSRNQKGIVDNKYAFTNGTSFATPIVSGVVALMVSVNPSLTPDQIREILIQSADKIGDNANYKNGFDTYRAYGKINASKAVKLAQDYLSQQ